MASKLPYIAFYPGDWRKEIGLQSLSYHHRGIWFELIMFMHCSEERGRLVLAGKPMPNSAVARLLGLSEQDSINAIEALIESGVASRDQNGVVYCRRMVREENQRLIRREAGSKGGSKTQANREATPYQTLEITNEVDIENAKDMARERVRGFVKGEGLSVQDADWFFDKCEGNGWTNAGECIRDWKATIRSWQRISIFPSQRGRNGERALNTPFNERKKPAPTGEAYQRRPPANEPTEQERANAKKQANELVDGLRKQFKMP